MNDNDTHHLDHEEDSNNRNDNQLGYPDLYENDSSSTPLPPNPHDNIQQEVEEDPTPLGRPPGPPKKAAAKEYAKVKCNTCDKEMHRASIVKHNRNTPFLKGKWSELSTTVERNENSSGPVANENIECESPAIQD